MENKNYTVKQVAYFFGVKAEVIDSWISTGKMKVDIEDLKKPISENNVLDFIRENPEYLEHFVKAKKNKKIFTNVALILLGIPPIASDLLANKIVNNRIKSPEGASMDKFDKTKQSIEKTGKWIKEHPAEFALIVCMALAGAAKAYNDAFGDDGYDENTSSNETGDFVYPDYNVVDESDTENSSPKRKKPSKYMDYKYKIKDSQDEGEADMYLREALEDDSLTTKQKDKLEIYEAKQWGAAFEDDMKMYNDFRGGDDDD